MQNSLTEIKYSPPKSDELEVSLFGPGVGECIVTHLGHGKWLVVDSCLNPETKNPIALDYLEKLGVNLSSAIVLFVISHWHNDHICGASKIVKTCPSARVCYSSALLDTEFLSLVSALSGSERVIAIDRATSNTREMASIVSLLKKRCEKNKDYNHEYMVPTGADKILFDKQYEDFQTEVRSLSPSDKSVNNALIEFASLIPDVGELRRALPRPTQNHNAIALWIQFGENKVLLGADLEETGDPLTGWCAIVKSPTRPNGKASIFKIPHHGSDDAHSDDVWKNMVDPSVTGILTSKIGGRSSIPKQSDIDCLKGHTSNLYCTNLPTTKRIKRNRTVEKTLKGIVKDRKILGGKIGHIQVRLSLHNDIKVNLAPPATAL